MQGQKTDRNAQQKQSIFIRDPLYGFVELNQKEKEILNSRVLQRLTRIKQLGHTYIVYPSAVYNRFEHSIGATYVAGRICEQLEISKEDAQIVRIAALLHDIGHGPFSHVFEQIMDQIVKDGLSHSKIAGIIIENDPELKKILKKTGSDVLTTLGSKEENVKCEIISGPLDADRLDYLRRDSYHTGVAYGVFDFERIIQNLCLITDEEIDYVCIHEKGKDAIESYRMARYLMHTQVYQHHTRLIAEDMFLRAIKFALAERILDEDALNPDKDVQRFLEYYLSLDDSSIQHLILSKSKGKAGKIIRDLLNRKLLKRAYMIPISAEAIPDYTARLKLMNMKRDQIEKLEQAISSKTGLGPENLVLHLQSTEIKLYEHLEDISTTEEKPILVRQYDGTTRHIGEESPFSASKIPKRLYVFCSDKKKSEVAKIAEEIIGVKNYYMPSNK